MELESGATAASEESESPPRSQASQASAALQADYARLIRNQSLQSQLGLTKSGIDLLEQMVVGDEESARAAQQVLESLVGQSDHDQRSQVDVSANQISLWNDSAQTMVMDACDFPLDHTPDAMDQLSHAPAGFISCPSWDWAADEAVANLSAEDESYVQKRVHQLKEDCRIACGKRTRENNDQTSSNRWNRRNIKEEEEAVGDPTVPAQHNLWHREASGNKAANPGSASVHRSVATIRACAACWSPDPPMCPSCTKSMKQKKARVVTHEPVFRFF
jgi:hypothetical protein